MRVFLALAASFGLALFFMATGALAQNGYGIRAGDILRIEVLEDPGLNRSALVAPDGRISLPLVGTLKVSGQSVEQVQAAVTSKIASNFATTPNVFVSVERLAERVPSSGPVAAATIPVYVMGEAAKPGKLEVAPGTTVLQLFAEMGGFSNFAATKRIQLRRDGKIYGLNYDAIESGISNAGATVLQDGDVIVVPQRRLFE